MFSPSYPSPAFPHHDQPARTHQIPPVLGLEKDFSLLISTMPNKQGPFPLLLLLLALPHLGFPSWRDRWVLTGPSHHTLAGKYPSFGTFPEWDEARSHLKFHLWKEFSSFFQGVWDKLGTSQLGEQSALSRVQEVPIFLREVL